MKVRSSPSNGSSSIRERIAEARMLLPDGKAALSRDENLQRLLEEVREKADATHKALIDCGVAAVCKRCEEKDGGSCCGAGIEDRYSTVLLLINLLLESTLPEEQRDEKSCFFLGEKGCRLAVCDTLCTNYLCREVWKMLAHDDLAAIQNIAGEEMDAVFALHEALKRALKR